jgi:hypothetical protein
MVALPTRRCPRTCSSIRQFAAPGIPITLKTQAGGSRQFRSWIWGYAETSLSGLVGFV